MASDSLEEPDPKPESAPDPPASEPSAPGSSDVPAAAAADADVSPEAEPQVEAPPEPSAAVEAGEPVGAVADALEPAALPLAAPVAAAAVIVEPAPPASPPAVPPTWQAPAEASGPFPGVKFADHGKRLLAFILDVVFAGLLTAAAAIGFLLLTLAFFGAGLGLLAIFSGISVFLSLVFVSLVYWPYFWTKSGRTPGMRIMGTLRVVMDKDGGPVGLGTAILRLVGYWVDTIILGLPIGYVWILIDDRRRGWHDLIASTVVIQDE